MIGVQLCLLENSYEYCHMLDFYVTAEPKNKLNTYILLLLYSNNRYKNERKCWVFEDFKNMYLG